MTEDEREQLRAELLALGVPIRTRKQVVRFRIACVAILTAIVAGFFVQQDAANDAIRESNERLVAETEAAIEATQYAADLGQTLASQAGCERTNRRFLPLYEFFGSAITRAEADSGRFNVIAATDYKGERKALVTAVADVAKFKGSPEVDCLAAFPLPAPPDPAVP